MATLMMVCLWNNMSSSSGINRKRKPINHESKPHSTNHWWSPVVIHLNGTSGLLNTKKWHGNYMNVMAKPKKREWKLFRKYNEIDWFNTGKFLFLEGDYAHLGSYFIDRPILLAPSLLSSTTVSFQDCLDTVNTNYRGTQNNFTVQQQRNIIESKISFSPSKNFGTFTAQPFRDVFKNCPAYNLPYAPYNFI